MLTASLTLAWMSAIFRLSSSAPADLPRQLEAFNWMGDLRDEAGHLFLYSGLGFLLMSSMWVWGSTTDRLLRWTLMAIVIGVFYGISDEVHQAFVPGRAASLVDVGVDSVGVITTAVVYRYVVMGLGAGLCGRIRAG